MSTATIATILLLGVFLVLVFLRVPVVYAIGVASLLDFFYLGINPMQMALKFVSNLNSCTLLALPFVIHIIAIRYVPLAGWALAFFNYKPGRDLATMPFVGLKYFKLIGFYREDVLNALVTGSGATSFAICPDSAAALRFAQRARAYCDWTLVCKPR